MNESNYLQFIESVKRDVLESRYKAASLANRELLLLYFQTGAHLNEKIKKDKGELN